MGLGVSSNEDIINQINYILSSKKECVINIVNDKLTLSVFSLLEKNLKNVKEINLIIRDTRYIPKSEEIAREFEIETKPKEMLFNEYDIIEKNKLQYFRKAKSMYEFIKKYVSVKKVKPEFQVRSNIIIIDEDFMIQGSSSLELSAKDKSGRKNRINFDTVINSDMDKSQIKNAKSIFNQIWYGENITEEYKEQLLKSLSYVYKEYSPEFLYYFTLNELFGNQLDYGIERFEKDNNSFKKSEIWNKLFNFQKDAVLSAIQKINKYNGCIIADSVGLGKTFEALAVIKYFELRQDNVLVLTPAKLYDNWSSFKGDYVDGPLNETFNYKIMFHTDLSRYKGFSKEGKDLSRFDWSKFDLIVIDESHNFRNRTENEDGSFTRYQRLLNAIKKGNGNTKVLMLSATPVNNSLADLKNQISLITADRDFAFEENGIKSVDNLLRRTSTVINRWDRKPNKKKEELFDELPPDFYKLLEMMTIARSRKHITNYYGTDQIGTFPNKLEPDTHTPNVDIKREFINFKDTNELLTRLTLAVYAPISYVKGEYIHIYKEKYETLGKDGRVLLSNELRESGTKTLHRFNLFKRLESSVYSFGETIRRLIERINGYIDAIEKSENNKTLESELDDEEDIVLNYKFEVKVEHLNKGNFLNDLYYDKSILEKLYKEVTIILRDERDEKIHELLEVITNKIKNTPYNYGNKKILIFTAFADTADYLYKSLQGKLLNLGCYVGCVSGSGKPKCNNKNVVCEYNSILSAFSPESKLGKTLPIDEGIDILIGTDCISAGQNLQDCDTVINYDIQWNPVSLIQRFGRIDRIGSKNKEIKMINFFPAIELNEYLNLEQRVKGKMVSVNLVSTGDEDRLSPEMNDLNFRKKQLEKLREEVIDIDEASDTISLTDLNMNEYLYELSNYIKEIPEVKEVPRGIYSVTDGEKKGVIFCFKHKNVLEKPKNESSLYPYYLLYISNSKEIYFSNVQAREVLKDFRKLCYRKDEPNKELLEIFFKKTKNVKDMSMYSELLSTAIESIQGNEEKNAVQSIFDFGGFNNEFANENADDFELISFLVVE